MNEEIQSTPPELREIAINATDKLIPEKSKSQYEKSYNIFLNWTMGHQVTSITENVLIAYFQSMGQTKKSSTIWTNYSMLRSMLSIKRNIDISKFTRLIALLKTFSKGYQPKKSQILDFDQITRFVTDAPDQTFLVVKVVLIMGYCGAMRREELTHMSIDDVDFKTDMILVTVPKTKTNVSRLFAITEHYWIACIRKYVDLRPSNTSSRRFFFNYRNGKCTNQPIGINKIGQMPKVIATFLQLPNAKLFSGHCFRRSSASHLANSGGDLLTIKRHGGWKSSTVAEGYVEGSLKKRVEISQMLSNQPSSIITSASQIASCSRSLIDDDIQTQCEFPESSDKVDQTVQMKESSVISLSETNLPGVVIHAAENCVIKLNVYNNCSVQK